LILSFVREKRAANKTVAKAASIASKIFALSMVAFFVIAIVSVAVSILAEQNPTVMRPKEGKNAGPHLEEDLLAKGLRPSAQHP
jgi:hypothetical protein